MLDKKDQKMVDQWLKTHKAKKLPTIDRHLTLSQITYLPYTPERIANIVDSREIYTSRRDI